MAQELQMGFVLTAQFSVFFKKIGFSFERNQVHNKTEQKVQRFPIDLLPPTNVQPHLLLINPHTFVTMMNLHRPIIVSQSL